MARRAGLGVVLGLPAAAALLVAVLPPMPQDPAYHRMADGRTMLGLPNALNVLSNVPFLMTGAVGLWGLLGAPGTAGGPRFVEARERWAYVVFFGALLLTGLGSGYYHLAPDNARLVWDRLPLAVTLMGLLAATISERVGVGLGLWLLLPLEAAAVGSVLHWYAGEVQGRGDLRLYGLVQFYPMLAVPLLLLSCAPRYTGGRRLLAALALYALAKGFEALDAPIFAAGSLVSGHTLKHLAAALAGYTLWRMLVTRRPA